MAETLTVIEVAGMAIVIAIAAPDLLLRSTAIAAAVPSMTMVCSGCDTAK